MTGPFLTVSEIGTYAFCPQAWYLQRRKVRPSHAASARLSDGIRAHQEIGRKTDRVHRGRRLQRLVLIVFVVLLAFIILQALSSVPVPP